jgi:hypothetical protein
MPMTTNKHFQNITFPDHAVRIGKAQCPRCGRILTFRPGQSEADCNCHLYCQYGSKPGDCTLTTASAGPDAFTGKWKWPSGLHNKDAHEGDDTQARVYYCTTHSVYTHKVPITVALDWEAFAGKRAPRKMRMSKQKY